MQESNLAISAPSSRDTELWWEWECSLDREDHPFLVHGNVEQNQEGNPFIALASPGGDGGIVADRSITIPHNKPMLVAVFVAGYSQAELGSKATDDELLRKARDDTKKPSRLKLLINGKRYEPYYVESGPFYTRQPSICIKDPVSVSPGKYRTLSAGHWALISNLPQGKNTIEFGGTNLLTTNSGQVEFDTDARYEVTVV